MNLDLTEVAKVLGVGAALAMVMAAAAYTALKVLRSDRTLGEVIGRIEQERDYYRDTLERERSDAKIERDELRRLLHQQGERASQERKDLRYQIEELRRMLQKYTLGEGRA